MVAASHSIRFYARDITACHAMRPLIHNRVDCSHVSACRQSATQGHGAVKSILDTQYNKHYLGEGQLVWIIQILFEIKKVKAFFKTTP